MWFIRWKVRGTYKLCAEALLNAELHSSISRWIAYLRLTRIVRLPALYTKKALSPPNSKFILINALNRLFTKNISLAFYSITR